MDMNKLNENKIINYNSNDKLNDKLDSKSKMTQLRLNIFENRKIQCGKINDWKIKDRKIKIEISNLNCLVENINNPP